LPVAGIAGNHRAGDFRIKKGRGFTLAPIIDANRHKIPTLIRARAAKSAGNCQRTSTLLHGFFNRRQATPTTVRNHKRHKRHKRL